MLSVFSIFVFLFWSNGDMTEEHPQKKDEMRKVSCLGLLNTVFWSLNGTVQVRDPGGDIFTPYSDFWGLFLLLVLLF